MIYVWFKENAENAVTDSDRRTIGKSDSNTSLSNIIDSTKKGQYSLV